MSRFVLTAQLQLQAPRNVNQVVNQIQRQLSGVTVDLNVQNGRQASRQIAQVNQQVNNLNKGAKSLGKNFGVSVKRFAAFSIANRAVSLFTSRLSDAIEESIDFQRELIKIKQVSGATDQALANLQSTITDLSTNLGTASKDLLATSRILAQTGLQAAQLEVALSALAKTTLAPTFENIERTAEGAVAIIAQFGLGVGALESQLGSINAVAGQFAVESGDLISAVRRTGGVFKSAGGDLNELLGLFTSVRATTRESAESIATGLRTIFTRIQRPETIKFLKQFGVELTDLNGKFVGPFDAVRQLSQALKGLEEGDIRFVEIAEELGGFRQIGKVIPLLQQFETAERARQAAVAGAGSLDKDAATAQLALAVQMAKTRENFLSLIRSLADTTSFQVLVKTTLSLADALISVGDALKPILPLMAAFAGFKIAKGLGSFAGAFRGSITGRNAGGPIGFATGGVVPGTGNRDTVPAMLTPGEFVIRKSSVSKIGAGTLAAMNQNKFNKGGKVKSFDLTGDFGLVAPNVNPQKNVPISQELSGSDLIKKLDKPTVGKLGISPKDKILLSSKFDRVTVGDEGVGKNDFGEDGGIIEKVANSIDSIIGTELSSRFELSAPKASQIINDKAAKSTISGYAFEQFVAGLTQKAAEGGGKPWDFEGASASKKVSQVLKDETLPYYLDAKPKSVANSNSKAANEVIKKGLNERLKTAGSGISLRSNKFFGGAIQKFALGGLAQKNKVGFSILDPDQGGADLSTNVTRAQVRAEVGGTKAQNAALDKELSWANKSYKVVRQGLPKKTSDKFYDTIIKEAVTGVDAAASSLSQTLGQGAISMPQSAKDTMTGVIRKSGSQMGRLFEDVLNVVDNKGDFKPAPIGAPWDFKNGLTGGLASTYNKMPSSFVDARTSYGRSTASAAQGKIIGELAEEYQKSSTFKTAKANKKELSASEQSAQEKRRAKQAARMAKMREKAGFAKGGAASDTVPALLTPGEFVINAKAASRIGKANLDRMNKKGVAGFAKGGTVGGVQYLNKGGPSSAGGGGFDPINSLFLVPTIIDSLSSSFGGAEENLNDLSTTSFSLSKAFSQFSSLILIGGSALSLFGKNLKDLVPVIKNITRGKFATRTSTLENRFGGINTSNTGGVRSLSVEQKRGRLELLKRRKADRLASARGNAVGSRVGRVFGSKAGDLVGAGAKKSLKTFNAVARFAGPIGIAAGGLLAFNSVLKAGQDFQGKYNAAIKAGNVERIKELGVLKEAPALFTLFGKDAAKAGVNLMTYFGGNSLASIEANANAQALAAKGAKEFEENAKEQAKATRDLISGTRTAAEVFKSGELTKNLKNAIDQAAADIEAAAEQSVNNRENRFMASYREFLARGTGIGSTNAEIELSNLDKEREAEKKAINLVTKSLEDNADANRMLYQETILAGGSFENAFSIIEEEAGGFKGLLSPEVLKAQTQTFINLTKNTIASLKIAKSLNSSLSILDSTARGLNTSLEVGLSKINGQFNEFSASLSELDAVTQGASIDPSEFSKTLDIVSAELRSFGASEATIGQTVNKFEDLNKVSNALPKVLANIKSSEDFTGNSEKFKESLGKALAGEVSDGTIKNLLQDSSSQLFEGIDFSDLKSDVSEQIRQVVERLSSGAVIDKEVLQQLDNAYKNQADILKEVYEAEKKVMDAKLASIDVENKNAKILEEFGVRSFTVSQRMDLLNKKIDEGVGKGVGSGGQNLSAAVSSIADEINKKKLELSTSSNAKENQKINNEIKTLQDRLSNANKVISEEIDIKRESLKLAKERLKLDREAVDALLAGDIETFLQKEESSGARQALTSGNTAALQEFSPRAIGEALKSIKDVDEKRKAADTAVASGAISQSMANVLTEDTPEIQGIRQDVESLAKAQSTAAEAAVSTSETDLSITNQVREQSDIKFAEAVNKFAEAVKLNDETNVKLDTRMNEIETKLEQTEKEAAAREKKTTEAANKKESERQIRGNTAKAEDQFTNDKLFEGLTDEKSIISDEIRREGSFGNGQILNKNRSLSGTEQAAAQERLSSREQQSVTGAINRGEVPFEARRLKALVNKQQNDSFFNPFDGLSGDEQTEMSRLKQLDFSESDRKEVKELIETLKRQEEQERAKKAAETRARTYAASRGSNMSKGGFLPLYASRGRSIFKPRGTDTVPAMLTPGEYVVNRKGTERGDNKAVLSAMNRGATFTNGVYNNEGGGGSTGIDTTALQNIASTLSTSFSKFSETVNRLINFKFEMTIAPTRVDVVINTPQAMNQMKDGAKEELLTAVVNEISINQLGKLRRNRNA